MVTVDIRPLLEMGSGPGPTQLHAGSAGVGELAQGEVSELGCRASTSGRL